MHWFLKLIVIPLLDALDPRTIVEVGVEVGAVSRPLLEWAREHDALLHCIDPDPNLSVEELTAEYGQRLCFHRQKSLDVLGALEAVDVALIDGDHNWYTVINELRALERGAGEQERPAPLILLHDVGWPYGRRDLYYDPDAIPEADRQPHARMGIVLGQSELGVGLNEHLENARLEGTPANGVLTAVEDFVAESPGDWRSFSTPGLSGLAILATSALLAERPAVAAVLERIDTPALLREQCEQIERARLQSELKRASLSRRLAEAQLKQVMRRVDPEELVELHRRNRELEDRARELERQVEAGEEDRALVRLLTEKLEHAQADAGESEKAEEPPEEPPTDAERGAAEGEREARQIFLDQFLPVAEGAPADRSRRDPLALPAALDPRGLLCDEGELQEPGEPSVDVVVCVHDALDDARRCLWSLTHKTDRRFRLIVVDDGSDTPTAEHLDALAARLPALTLIRRERPPHGYTLAANAGLRASGGDYVVLLNSDTVVSPGWLRQIVAHGERDSRVGILGPLSNAASHQSVPELRHDGAWAVNQLPDWLTVDGAAAAVELGGPGLDDAPRGDGDPGLAPDPTVDARLPFLNGFCYAIKRAVIDAVGYLDEERFPGGYCEENDYSQRARDAGFELAVVADAYVHHAKSRSYGADGRNELARGNYELFRAKHSPERIDALVAAMEADATLAPVRAAFTAHTAEPAALAALLTGAGGAEDGRSENVRGRRPLSVVFILPGLPHGGSGGSHSVYQEVTGLRSLGVPARIAIPSWDRERARAAYPDADDVFQTFADPDDLAAVTADADVISATHYKSVALLAALRERREDFLAAYYVQDYEPFFTAPYIAAEAIASYTAVPGTLLFAKSHWLCNVVADRHGLLVEKVEPSLDERVFFPGEHTPRLPSAPLRVAAMIRPRTARRQPVSTVNVLERLREQLGERVEIATFGCYADELREIAPRAHAIHAGHRGLLPRHDVAELLRRCDVFLDMSVYQAFGRTALEAMACGATAVVPEIGGVWEFVEHDRNALAVDTLDEPAVLDVLTSLAGDRDRLDRLRAEACVTAARYSIARAALSEQLLFARAHRARVGARARVTA